MLNKTLIKFSSVWSNEFLCEECAIAEASVKECKEAVRKAIENEMQFGTTISFCPNTLDLEDFDFIPIKTSEEENILNRFLKLNAHSTYGTGIIDYILEEL